MSEIYVTRIFSENGDWEAIYINEDLVAEGHSVDPIKAVVKTLELLGFDTHKQDAIYPEGFFLDGPHLTVDPTEI
jgi:hypothetical protein